MPDIFIKNKKKEIDNLSGENSGLINVEHHIHHLASFEEKPLGISFKNQEADEEILLFLRRHFITNFVWIFFSLIFLFLPFLFIFSLPFFGDSFSIITSLSLSFKIFLLLFYYLLIFNYILINFLNWYFNISIVTQKRIIDIDFADLVYHDVAVTKLSLVEDVNYTQTGFLRGLFDYGDVFVQTAGEQKHFDFLAVPNPSRVVHIIQDLIGKRRDH